MIKNRLPLYISNIILILLLIFLLNPLKAQDLKQQADDHYQKGVFFYNQGRYNEAQKEFEKAVQLIEQEKKITEAKKEQIPLTQKEFKADGLSSSRKKTPAYIISEGDVLLIKIWQNQDLDSEVIVQPDGTISFPLLGEVMVSGLAVKETREKLTEQLKEYIKCPQVSVSLVKMSGQKVIILGQVNNPGVYTLRGTETILEAMGLAGGFTQHAQLASVVLVRGGLKNPTPRRLNLTKAIKRGDVADNVILVSEDIVYVPKRFIADLNYFLSMILDPISRGIYVSKEIRDW